MPASSHTAIVIVLDIGKSVSVVNCWEGKSFFKRAKECVSWIIQRKLISNSQDVLSLVLIGSNEVNNSWAASGYENINLKFEFEKASWEMLKFVEMGVKTTDNKSDWIGGLMMSMNILNVYEGYNNVENKKIVFFSDFTHPASGDLDVITKNLKDFNINLSIIGPDNILHLVQSQSCEREEEHINEPAIKRFKIVYEKSQERQEGEKLVYKLWKKVPELIIICTFEAALKQLCSFTRKSCRITPWNCIMDIGDVKISISMFKKTDPHPSKKFDAMYVRSIENEMGNVEMPQTSNYSSRSEFLPVNSDKVMYCQKESQKDVKFDDVEIEPEDTTQGFHYGVTVIPFLDEYRDGMNYKPGRKSFSVLGFTEISRVPFYLLSGECSYVVSPRDRDKNAKVALSALIQAMKQLNCLAIVRRVYSDDRGLSLGILHPFIEETVSDETDEIVFKECLLFVELAFEEDINSIYFPSLEKITNTEEQIEAVDELIEKMDLMNAAKGLTGEPCEALDFSSLHDFKEQFFHYCVIQKGLHPEKSLPKSLPSYIKNYVRLPELIEDKCKIAVEKLKEKFEVTVFIPAKMNAKQKKLGLNFNFDSENTCENLFSQNEPITPHFEENSINNEQNPLKRNLMNLFGKTFPKDSELDKFVRELKKDDKTKWEEVADEFLEIISSIRQLYMNKNPDLFNWWMMKVKFFLSQRSSLGEKIWNLLVEGNLGLISTVENKYSNVTEEEAEEFLHMPITESPNAKNSDSKALWDSDREDSDEEEITFDFLL